MTDFAFYNAGTDEPRGLRRAIVPIRRAARRLLRPIFIRQAELMAGLAARMDEAESGIQGLHHRLDRTSDQMQDTIAFGWDYVAMVRRLAALEDRVEAMQTRSETSREDEGQMHLPFPDLDDGADRAKAS